MGFFSDLKQDLSQAVDEMADGDDLKENDTVQAETGNDAVTSDPAGVTETAGIDNETDTETDNEGKGSDIDDVDLAAMLDKVAGNGMEADESLESSTSGDEVEIPPEVTGDGTGIAEEDVTGDHNDEADDTVQDDSDTDHGIDTDINTDTNTYTDKEKFSSQTGDIADNADAGSDDSVFSSSMTDIVKDDIVSNKKGKEKMSDTDEKMTPVDETASVTAGMTITGDVKSAGSLDMIGSVMGNIDILGKLNVTGSITGDSKAAEIYAESAKITGELHSTGSVKIGQSTVVIGNVFASSAVIAGAVKGDIDVQGPVILDTSAIVMGNIKSKSVQINNGAVIEGMCSQCYADVNPSSFFEEFKKQK